MKKVISLLISTAMILSSLSVVFAAEVPTVTMGDYDATEVEDNGEFSIPVTIDKFPEGTLKQVSLEITFDKTKLEFVGQTRAMKVWYTDVDTEAGEEPYLWNATWLSTPSAINADNGAILFTDSSGGKQSFTAAESLAANNTLVKLKFKKLPGATGETEISFREIILTDTYTNADGTNYKMSTNEVIGVSSTVTLPTGGATDTVEKVATSFIGGDNNEDTEDFATAVYAELNGDAEKTYTAVNWSVTASGATKSHAQAVNVSGEATYKFGLVIRGLAQDTVTAVAAALAE